MIQATKGQRGQEQATATCDNCGAKESVTASHGSTNGGRGQWHKSLSLSHPKQASEKLVKMGWLCTSRSTLCPQCKPQHEKQEKPVEAKIADVMPPLPPELRRPSGAQKRQIIALLEEVYDDKAKRYTGDETDKTVAHAIGSDVMWGWVAEIREELFGPDGSNAEMDAIQTEVSAAMKSAGALVQAVEKNLGELKDLRGKFEDLHSRVEAVKRAVGPRVRT